MEENKKNIFDVITEYSVNDGLDVELLQNEEYIKIQKKINEHADWFEKQDFTQEQRLMIDRLISAHTENSAFYGKMAYRQGFRDCASLLLEMDLIKAS